MGSVRRVWIGAVAVSTVMLTAGVGAALADTPPSALQVGNGAVVIGTRGDSIDINGKPLIAGQTGKSPASPFAQCSQASGSILSEDIPGGGSVVLAPWSQQGNCDAPHRNFAGSGALATVTGVSALGSGVSVLDTDSAFGSGPDGGPEISSDSNVVWADGVSVLGSHDEASTDSSVEQSNSWLVNTDGDNPSGTQIAGSTNPCAAGEPGSAISVACAKP